LSQDSHYDGEKNIGFCYEAGHAIKTMDVPEYSPIVINIRDAPKSRLLVSGFLKPARKNIRPELESLYYFLFSCDFVTVAHFKSLD